MSKETMKKETTMPSNQAAYFTDKWPKPLQVQDAPYTPPAENEIVIENHAIAINPVDWLKHVAGDVMFSWIKRPFVLGSDVAGNVVEVGKQVTRFQVGDRVVGVAFGIDKRSNSSAEGAFQKYTVLRSNLASPIPDSLSYESAAVLPLGLSTAGCGLFLDNYLGLTLPKPHSPPRPNGETLLVWGGSTSVGCNAIQLAVLAGYEVIATASPKNFDYLKKLGATAVFDYRSKTAVADMIDLLSSRSCAGALAIGKGSSAPCIEIVGACKGKKFVAQTTFEGPEFPTSFLGFVPFLFGFLWKSISLVLKAKMKGVGAKFIWGTDIMDSKISNAIFEDFLPIALAQGTYTTAPEPIVAGKGLECIQEGMDLQRKGVSAKKVVISL